MHAYLDHNASGPLLDEAKTAMLAAMERVGNPSSTHKNGRLLQKLIEDARQRLATVADIAPKQVVFTSGATEAANLALGTRIRQGNTIINLSHLYISSIEHPCILAGGRFGSDEVTKFAVHENGSVNLDELAKVLEFHDHSSGAPLVAVMLANNETGVIQPIEEIAGIVAKNKGYLCVDAVQAFGKMQIDFKKLGAHFVLLSAHKIGGPIGAGALLMMDEAISPQVLIAGGRQENLLRAGTQNALAIAGFDAAINAVTGTLATRKNIRELRDNIESGLEDISRQSGNKIPLPVIFGASQNRLDNTSCFAIEGIKAETALIALDLEGISVSSGSACSSGRINQSHVLSAMGVSPELAECTLRVSIGHQTTKSETGHFLNAWKNIVERRV